MPKYEYKNLQFKTVPNIGVWSRLAEPDLRELERWLGDDWEMYRTVNIRGSFGFTAHVLFMLRREVQLGAT
jgi:hypothetical protein